VIRIINRDVNPVRMSKIVSLLSMYLQRLYSITHGILIFLIDQSLNDTNDRLPQFDKNDISVSIDLDVIIIPVREVRQVTGLNGRDCLSQ
jgi:hypothetical protein